jgi:hypothetical protein
MDSDYHDSDYRMEEQTEEEIRGRYELILKTIHIVDNNLSINEDFLVDCQDLVIAYYVNFIDNSVKHPIIDDEIYMNILKQTNHIVEDIYNTIMKRGEQFPILDFHKFCKNIVLMINRIEHIELNDNQLSNMMNELSVTQGVTHSVESGKTNKRKLKK